VKVSFVIPTRNQAQFIRKCIDSCIAQGVDSEIVVVDGNSTDGTQAVLAEYGERLRFISEKDSGQSEALNKGVHMAKGEIVAWLNSDDYYPHDGVLKRVLDHFDEHTDVVYGDGVMVDVKGNVIRPFPSRRVTTPREIVLLPSGFVLQPALFFRRQRFLDVGGVDLGLHWAMDYDLWIRMFERARGVQYLPEVLAHATYHDNAKSVGGMWKQIREFSLIKHRHQRLLNGPLDRLRLEAGMASLYAYYAAVRLGLKRAT
jgi:glycosyltransferase involved in cell wall biosynthesis